MPREWQMIPTEILDEEQKNNEADAWQEQQRQRMADSWAEQHRQNTDQQLARLREMEDRADAWAEQHRQRVEKFPNWQNEPPPTDLNEQARQGIPGYAGIGDIAGQIGQNVKPALDAAGQAFDAAGQIVPQGLTRLGDIVNPNAPGHQQAMPTFEDRTNYSNDVAQRAREYGMTGVLPEGPIRGVAGALGQSLKDMATGEGLIDSMNAYGIRGMTPEAAKRWQEIQSERQKQAQADWERWQHEKQNPLMEALNPAYFVDPTHLAPFLRAARPGVSALEAIADRAKTAGSLGESLLAGAKGQIPEARRFLAEERGGGSFGKLPEDIAKGKPSAKTGFTKGQEKFLAEELEKIAPKLPETLPKGAADYFPRPGQSSSGPAPKRPTGGVTISVPGDGDVTVWNQQQAQSIHHFLTGKPIPEIGPVEPGKMGLPSASKLATTGESTNALADEMMRIYGRPEEAAQVIENQLKQVAALPEAERNATMRGVDYHQVLDMLKQRATGTIYKSTNVAGRGIVTKPVPYDVDKELVRIRGEQPPVRPPRAEPLAARPSQAAEVAPSISPTVNKSAQGIEAEYEDALAEARAASREFSAIQSAYRARKIGDAEFLAGRDAFNKSQAAFDAAETRYIEAKNSLEQSIISPAPEVAPLQAAPTEAAKPPWGMTLGDYLGENSLGGSELYRQWELTTGRSGKSQAAQNEIAAYRERTDRGLANAHRQFVEQALAEGKPVPEVVLRDYPDLTTRTSVPSKGFQSDSPVFEGSLNSLSSNTKAISDVAKSETFSKQGLGGFDIPTQRLVLNRVLASLHQSEIRDVIVKTIPIDVVDNLVRQQLPTNVILHNSDMDSNFVTILLDGSVSLRRDTADSLVSGIARLTAEKKLGTTQAIRDALKDVPTLRASELYHKSSIPQNTSKGKPEVLADYPDLAAKVSPPASPEALPASKVPPATRAMTSEEAKSAGMEGFEDTFSSPMAAAKASQQMNLKRIIAGTSQTRREYVNQAIDSGAKVETREGQRSLVFPDGRYMRESELTKTGMDYAEFKAAKASPPPTLEALPANAARAKQTLPEAAPVAPEPVGQQTTAIVPTTPSSTTNKPAISGASPRSLNRQTSAPYTPVPSGVGGGTGGVGGGSGMGGVGGGGGMGGVGGGGPAPSAASITAPRTAGLQQFWDRARNVIAAQGSAGKELAGLLRKTRDVAEIMAGHWTNQLPTVRKLGKDDFINFVDAAEGNAAPANAAVQAALNEWVRVREHIYNVAKAVGLDVGRLPDYFPHTYDPNMFKGDNWVKAVNHLVSTGQAATPDIAAQMLRHAQDVLRNRRYGNLEIPRIVDLPGYEKTKQALFGYVESSANRISQVAHLGKDDSVAMHLINKIGEQGYDASAAKNLFDIAIGAKRYGDIQKEISAGVRAFNVIAKMGLGALTNAGQSVNTMTVAGGLRTLSKLPRALFSEQAYHDALEAGTILDSTLHNLREGAGYAGKFAKIGAPGFNIVERFNRVFAGEAGMSYAADMARKAVSGSQSAAKALETMGLDANAIIARGGGLQQSEQIQAARNMVERTQFKVDPQDLPGWASSPWGKIIMQFRTFSYNQSAFIGREVLLPALHGDVRPLLRLLVFGLPVGAAGVEAADFLRNRVRDADPLQTITRYYQKVGGLGLLGDLVTGLNPIGATTPAGYLQRAASALGGPTIGTAAEGLAAVSSLGQGKPVPLERFGLKQIPLVGPTLQNTLFPYQNTQNGGQQLTPLEKRMRQSGSAPTPLEKRMQGTGGSKLTPLQKRMQTGGR